MVTCGKGRGVDPIHGRSTDRLSARWSERNSGNEIRALVGCVAGSDGRAGAGISDVERGASARCNDVCHAPAAEDCAGDSGLRKECFSRAEGKIVDGIGIDDVTGVEISRGALAGHAGRVLRIVGISASGRILVDLVRVGVVGGDQQTAGKAALKTGDEAIIGTAVGIAAPSDLAEGRIGAQAGCRIDEVDIRSDQQEVPFAAHVGECADQIVGKRPLHGESPLDDVHVLAIAVVGICRNRAGAVEEGRDGIRKPGGRLGAERVRAHFVLDGDILVVELAVAVVEAEAGANDGFAAPRADGDQATEMRGSTSSVLGLPKLAPTPQKPAAPQVAKSKGLAFP